jgi:hypothetical protein
MVYHYLLGIALGVFEIIMIYSVMTGRLIPWLGIGVTGTLFGGLGVIMLGGPVGGLAGGLVGILGGSLVFTLVGTALGVLIELNVAWDFVLYAVVILLSMLLSTLFIFRLFEKQLDCIEQKYIVNPISRSLLILGRQIPHDFERFLNYCTGAMLLKRAGNNYAFVHDMLRDYFALRELILRLRDPDPDARLLTVQRLARLGETAQDALETATRDEDERVCQAALIALNNKETIT